jgi:pentapeptide MXKDX repeat protein
MIVRSRLLLPVVAIALAFAFAVPAAIADDMSKDSMSKDTSMKKDSMSKDKMSKDKMSKDSSLCKGPLMVITERGAQSRQVHCQALEIGERAVR